MKKVDLLIALYCAHFFAFLRVKTERTPSVFGDKLLVGNFIFKIITISEKKPFGSLYISLPSNHFLDVTQRN